MVHFLLEAGADQEHKTDEMHTALMEACMVRGDTHAQTSVPYKQVFTSMTKHFSSCNEYFTSPGGKPGELSINCRKCLRVSDRDGWLLNLFPRAVSAPLLPPLQDGHVEVARLLLDSGAQVNMPADSFESPLTLAACGGHVELAALLIERGANLEEVNDEGYTPLMEAAREGHEEMVALLLAQGEGLLQRENSQAMSNRDLV